ncbi:hypothetical protein [Paraclostridium bifermentans]|uniref:hypothetical protein n=1 Tax=Paraclostridium bifermentans TaxID=1490 RepID=UPI00189F98FA|nr:hypothetical protein [Paraclostridium bifermentans]
MNNRLEELLRMKEDIEAEIEMLENEEVVNSTLEDLTADLLEELAEADEDTCIHCLVKNVLYKIYWLGYNDAYEEIE